MTIRILTLEREYGSGGGAIAEKVAARLGWKLWDQLLTEEIARRLECDCKAVEEREERRDPAYYRLFRAFQRGSFEGSLNAPRLRMVDTECVRDMMRKLLPEIADTGNCVIVGRGSAYYLGTRTDAFHVFIYAPFPERVRRLRAEGKSEKEATELAETVDRDRAAFIKRHFDVEWPGRHRFHLMVNSGLGEEVAVDIILDAVARFRKQKG
ncbi:MAG TPA: cytidylate kinase-like family protein [Candidatus Acidoferrales bacterium]|nr:cytidylate kinase-like family protein [Candidatus Acidoferrales bacterium]